MSEEKQVSDEYVQACIEQLKRIDAQGDRRLAGSKEEIEELEELDEQQREQVLAYLLENKMEFGTAI